MAATLTAAASQKPLAYVYSSDLGRANEFKNYLGSQGYSLTLIPQANVQSTNLNPYKVILIGHETGSLANWGDNPGNQANSIASSGKPILGLGEGGYAFFGKLGLIIGYGNGAHGGGQNVYAVSPASPIWNSPYNVSVPASQLVSLYNTNSSYVAIYYPSPLMGTEGIGSESSSSSHYPLITQVGPFFLWGFEDGPNNMTNKGQRVFVNVLEYLIP